MKNKTLLTIFSLLSILLASFHVADDVVRGVDKWGLDQLSFVFWFMIVFAGFLFATRPAVNTAQILFRVGLMLVGAAGLTALKMRRKS
jgi:hypothetical protein